MFKNVNRLLCEFSSKSNDIDENIYFLTVSTWLSSPTKQTAETETH